MLSKRHKLAGHIGDDFFVGAKSWNLPWGRIYFRVPQPVDNGLWPRVTTVVPKKLVLRSYQRHQIKRLIYQEWRRVVVPGPRVLMEVVIVANERALDFSAQEVRWDLHRFARYRLWGEKTIKSVVK